MVRAETYNGLFDHGKRYSIQVKGFGGTNTNTPIAERVQKVRHYNDPERAFNNFTNSQPVLIQWQLKDDPHHSLVMMHRPGNPYGPIDSLVVATDDSMKPNNVSIEQITGREIYSLSAEAQQTYWQTAMAMLSVAHRNPHPSRGIVSRFLPGFRNMGKKHLETVFMENTTPLSYLDSQYMDKTGQSPATSRTIFYPHAHVVVQDKRWRKPHEWSMEHLDQEQNYLRSLFDSSEGKKTFATMQEQISNTLKKDGHSVAFTAHIDKGEPVGYVYKLDGFTDKNVLTHIPEITSFMKAHFDAYKQAASEIAKQSGNSPVIPQPAFRDYIYFDEKNTLTIRISPEVLSMAGVTEAAGLQMLRDPEYINPISPKKIDSYLRRWAKAVAKSTKKTTPTETTVVVSKFKRKTVEKDGKKRRVLRNVTFPNNEQ